MKKDNPVPNTRILLAEGHALFRAGLRSLLEKQTGCEVVGEAADALEAVRLAAELKPDVLLVDIEMVRSLGAVELRRLSAGQKGARILLLAAASDGDEIAKAFRHGVRGFVLRESAFKTLAAAVRSVADGKYWVGDEAAVKLGKRPGKFPDISARAAKAKSFSLTKRELEMVAAVVSGYSNKEIAGKFSISEDTVKHHITNIFDKLGVYNRLELVLFAIHHGLVGRS